MSGQGGVAKTTGGEHISRLSKYLALALIALFVWTGAKIIKLATLQDVPVGEGTALIMIGIGLCYMSLHNFLPRVLRW